MPELVEQMYCSQQIVIPPKFPYILKKYCKAAIKTQPYDLLRWSYEYFSALAENRPPPVKYRLEYPIYTTEGGLTRGCLKVLANQLVGSTVVPIEDVQTAWRGFCLDPEELNRILCLCEVYLRAKSVPFLHFIAVAGGLLTKTLTHTMILLCETLTKEPDGGSAAISVHDFLVMYKFLAPIDASKDVKYFNGRRDGDEPQQEEEAEETAEEKTIEVHEESAEEENPADEFWKDGGPTHFLSVTNDHVSQTTRLSYRLAMPAITKLERSPSMERAGEIERANYLRERKGRATTSDDIDRKLKELSETKVPSQEALAPTEAQSKGEAGANSKRIVIIITDPEGAERIEEEDAEETEEQEEEMEKEANILVAEEHTVEEEKGEVKESEKERIQAFVQKCIEECAARREDLLKTFADIQDIVKRFKSANYDLGMVAGRQMSTTSGEFIAHEIEKDILDYVSDEIALLPDPATKKIKAKPEEVAMIKNMLVDFVDENLDVCVLEEEEVEEEEGPVPEVTQVYCVPGIGPPVDEDYLREFEEYALEVSRLQAGMFMPRNIRHFMCPPLEKYEEPEYEKEKETEEVTMAGIIID